MQEQANPFKLPFYRQLMPHRQMTLTLSTSMKQSCQRLENAFADDIFLKGSFWQLSRRYWGHLNGNQFVLHGPKAHRQFCFRTKGVLAVQEEKLVVQLLIQLSRRDIFGLLYSLAFIFVFLFLISQEGGFLLMPFLFFFVGFIYVMLQWHLSHYATEIHQLVADIINDALLNANAN